MKCPLCTHESNIGNNPKNIEENWVDCNNCGKFSYLDNVIASDLDPETLAKLSHAVRKAQGAPPFALKADFIKEISKSELPTVVEQIDNLIIHIGKTSSPGETPKMAFTTHQAIVGSINKKGFYFIIDSAINDFGYLAYPEFLVKEENGSDRQDGDLLLTPKGWQRYEDLKRGTAQSRKAFMAMPFKNDEIDNVFTDCFIPAVAKTGFKLERVDTAPKAGLIDDKIKVDIRTARFVLADLTGNNNGVYWEAGFAEGLGKPVIYTCKKNDTDNTHFDTNHRTTIFWDKDSLEKTGAELSVAIRATLPDEAKMTDDEG